MSDADCYAVLRAQLAALANDLPAVTYAPSPDLRTADEIAADRDAELKAQLAALANEVTALRDAMHAQAQIVQALWLAHELAGDA